MGLDVGVVAINYIPDPQPPVYDFLYDMLLNPYTGIDDGHDDDEEYWGGSWSGNEFYEFGRAGLISRVENWARARAVSMAEKDDLISWVEALPWHDDMVMLHLGR